MTENLLVVHFFCQLAKILQFNKPVPLGLAFGELLFGLFQVIFGPLENFCGISVLHLVRCRELNLDIFQLFQPRSSCILRVYIGYDRVDFDVPVNFSVHESDLDLGTKDERMGRATKVEHPELVTSRNLVVNLNGKVAS